MRHALFPWLLLTVLLSTKGVRTQPQAQAEDQFRPLEFADEEVYVLKDVLDPDTSESLDYPRGRYKLTVELFDSDQNTKTYDMTFALGNILGTTIVIRSDNTIYSDHVWSTLMHPGDEMLTFERLVGRILENASSISKDGPNLTIVSNKEGTLILERESYQEEGGDGEADGGDEDKQEHTSSGDEQKRERKRSRKQARRRRNKVRQEKRKQRRQRQKQQ